MKAIGNPKLGKTGQFISLGGVVLAFLAQAFVTTSILASSILLVLGSFFYLGGAFLTVSAFGYVRKTTPFRYHQYMRLAIALSWALMMTRWMLISK